MITELTKHDDHEVSIRLCNKTSPHYAALCCIDCSKHIQWLSRSETEELKEYGVSIWDNNFLPRGGWL